MFAKFQVTRVPIQSEVSCSSLFLIYIHIHTYTHRLIIVIAATAAMPKLKKSTKGKKGAPRAAAPNLPNINADSSASNKPRPSSGLRYDNSNSGDSGTIASIDTSTTRELLLKRHRTEVSDEGGPLFIEIDDPTKDNNKDT